MLRLEVKKVGKLKYLGCYFHVGLILTMVFASFIIYGNFNNAMSVVGFYRNEIATLHLIRSYCIPTVLYVM